MKDQLISIKNDLLVLLSTVGGRGYSAEATPTNLLQLLKNLIPQQHAKIKEQNQKVGCHGDNEYGVSCYSS